MDRLVGDGKKLKIRDDCHPGSNHLENLQDYYLFLTGLNSL